MDDTKIPIEPKTQEFYDDNRKTYGGETHSLDIKKMDETKCNHFFERKSFTMIQCRRCLMGLQDNNRFMLENGKIVAVK